MAGAQRGLVLVDAEGEVVGRGDHAVAINHLRPWGACSGRQPAMREVGRAGAKRSADAVAQGCGGAAWAPARQRSVAQTGPHLPQGEELVVLALWLAEGQIVVLIGFTGRGEGTHCERFRERGEGESPCHRMALARLSALAALGPPLLAQSVTLSPAVKVCLAPRTAPAMRRHARTNTPGDAIIRAGRASRVVQARAPTDSCTGQSSTDRRCLFLLPIPWYRALEGNRSRDVRAWLGRIARIA